MNMERASLGTRVLNKFDPGSGPGRIIPMEGLRGLAALLVVFVHFDALFRDFFAPGTLRNVLDIAGRFGHAGVDVFFLLSGFLIYGMVFHGKTGYWHYLIRRAHRLYPTLLFVLAIYIAISLAMPQYSKILSGAGEAAGYIVKNVFMLPGMLDIPPLVTVAWSLSYEWFFYITIPLVIATLGMRRWQSWQRIVLFLMAAGALVFLAAIGVKVRLRLIMFCSGIVLWESASFLKVGSRVKEWGEPIAIVAFAVNLLALGVIGRGPTSLLLNQVSQFYAVSLFITGFFLALYSMFFDGILCRCFCWPWLRWLGNISYSYYLIHGLTLKSVRFAFDRFQWHGPLSSWSAVALLAGCLAATLCCASVLYLAIERPLSFRRRLHLGAVAPPVRAAELPIGDKGAARAAEWSR
jgi:peptidoglycan/LPS O-acetylase OafA/YrhL